MPRQCMECGKKKGLFARNYAGLRVRPNDLQPFPDRLNDFALPGDRRSDFLCGDCANKRKVVCTVHGEIPWRVQSEVPPTCTKCIREELDKHDEEHIRRRLRDMRARFREATTLLTTTDQGLSDIWLRWHQAAEEAGEASPDFRVLRAKALLWESCCYLCAAEKTKVVRQFKEGLVLTMNGDAEPLWQAAATKAKELAGRACAMNPQLRELSGQIISRSETVHRISLEQAASLPGYGTVEQNVTGGAILAPTYVLAADQTAVLASQLKAADLNSFVKTLDRNELLTQEA